jgi:hypothetical protein
MSQDQFFGRKKPDGTVSVLYRLTSFPDVKFQRWDQGKWIDASDLLERVTQDVGYDDIDLVTAVSTMRSQA